MNYYEHHLGDYAQATAHLSFIEDAAYSRLIRKYYAEEKPLPSSIKAVQRLVNARTQAERHAVHTILNEFFTLSDAGWHNKRCDEEIARYHNTRDMRQSVRENEKIRQRRHREERRAIFSALKTQGLSPQWDTPTTLLRTMLKEYQGKTLEAQRSDERAHKQSSVDASIKSSPSESHNSLESAATPKALLPTQTLSIQYLRDIAEAFGMVEAHAENPIFLEILETHYSVDEFIFALKETQSRGKSCLSYAIGIMRKRQNENKHKRAASFSPQRDNPHEHHAPEEPA